MFIIEVQNASSQQNVPDEIFITEIVNFALSSLSTTACSITIRIVDADEGTELNERYRNKKGPTNVLSFPFDSGLLFEASQDIVYLGDIVLCAPVITQEAKNKKLEIKAHYTHLLIHGLLHLHGYDHEQTHEAEIMEAKEINLLAQLGYKNPYES